MSNLNLNKAKSVKNDEFYTRLEDIEKEMVYYKEHFKNAVVYCNCDDPEQSNFWKYFHLHFEELGLKKLLATHKKFDGFSSYKMEYCGGNDSDVLCGNITPLKGDGDFKSEECVAVLKESDIVVTNPPFSLFRDFMSVLIEHGKNFLVLGNQNTVVVKNLFPLIMQDKLRYGVSLRNGGISFRILDEMKDSGGKFVDNAYYVTLGCVRWVTNLKHDFVPEPLILTKKYNPKDYPKYDNYDAIEVNKIKNIPSDYDEVMGVPITFLNKYNPNQFEIVGSTTYIDYKAMPNFWTPYPKKTKKALKNGKQVYQRIFIKRKK